MTTQVEYLDLTDFLLIAQQITGLDRRTLNGLPRIGLAESALAAPAAAFGGIEAYPDFHAKAAVLLIHLVKNHPLPDGNKRCGYLACREFIARNGRTWTSDSVAGTDRFIPAVASDETTFEEVVTWIVERVR